MKERGLLYKLADGLNNKVDAFNRRFGSIFSREKLP